MTAATPSPQDVVAAALRRERTRTGVSLSELARRADVAKSTLSQLESGSGNPSLETLWALANALDVPFSRLVEAPRSVVRLIRSGEGDRISAGSAAYDVALLASCPPAARVDVYHVAAEPGAPRVSHPHPVGTIEHVVMSAGAALVGPHDAPVRLAPGDYLSYPGDIEHVFDALEPGTSAVLLSEAR